MAKADLVIEKTYRVPMVHQGYIEPHAAIADYDPHGRITIWSSTQGSFQTRGEVADVLEIPEQRIKVIPMECGGAFGAKIRALVEPLAVLLSKAAGHPVSLIMSRREELVAGMPAPGVIIRLKTGVKNDGTPVALEAETIVEAGAYSGALLTMSAVFLASVYLWPTFDVRGFEVLTNKPSVAAYRAPLAPQTALRDRFAHGPHRAQARARPGRVQAALHATGRRHDGQRPALGRQRRARVLPGIGRASALEGARRLARQRWPRWPRPARHRRGHRRLGPEHPADQRHGAPGLGRHRSPS